MGSRRYGKTTHPDDKGRGFRCCPDRHGCHGCWIPAPSDGLIRIHGFTGIAEGTTKCFLHTDSIAFASGVGDM